MNIEEFLDLIQTYFLCPICGKWHKFKGDKPLKEYTKNNRYEHICEEREKLNLDLKPDSEKAKFKFYFDEKFDNKIAHDYITYFVYEMHNECEFELNTFLDAVALPTSVRGNTLKYTSNYLTFLPKEFNSKTCDSCKYNNCCAFSNNISFRKVGTNITFSFGFTLENLKKPNDLSIITTNNSEISFGILNDDNIISTIIGIAINDGKNFKIYDKDKNTLINIGDISDANLPIFVIPTLKLHVGDLILENDEYCYVLSIEKDYIQTLCVKTGEIHESLPIENVFGFNYYPKIVALKDMLDEAKDKKKLAMLITTINNIDKNYDALLPFILLLNLDENVTKEERLALLSMVIKNSSSCNNSHDNLNFSSMLMLPILSESSLLNSTRNNDLFEKLILSSMISSTSNNSCINMLLIKEFLDSLSKK